MNYILKTRLDKFHPKLTVYNLCNMRYLLIALFCIVYYIHYSAPRCLCANAVETMWRSTFRDPFLCLKKPTDEI